MAGTEDRFFMVISVCSECSVVNKEFKTRWKIQNESQADGYFIHPVFS
jgi:hypothetical protein